MFRWLKFTKGILPLTSANKNDQVIFTGKMQTLFVVTANISLRSTTFETVIESLVKCQESPSVYQFEHIRYLELFRDQLRNFYPDDVNQSHLGDDIANALMVIWEVDRVMPQNHWNQLKSYVASFSKKTPVPLLFVANLSEGIITATPDYVRRLARDIQWFLTVSFDDTPSKHLWKCLLLRNNLFQFPYFRAHFVWLHSKISLHPEVHVPVNWQELKNNSASLEEKSSKEILQYAQHIPAICLRTGAENRFLDMPHHTTQWYQGMYGELFVKAFGNGHMGKMTHLDFQNLMKGVSDGITQAEAAVGPQDWKSGEVVNECVKEIVCQPGAGQPQMKITLTHCVRPWEATLIIAQAIPRIRRSQESLPEAAAMLMHKQCRESAVGYLFSHAK